MHDTVSDRTGVYFTVTMARIDMAVHDFICRCLGEQLESCRVLGNVSVSPVSVAVSLLFTTMVAT